MVLFDKHYWEAWRVNPKSGTATSPVWKNAIDGWRLGTDSSGVPIKARFEGKRGEATFEGWARYRDGICLKALNASMKGSEPWAHRLWNSNTNPNFGSKNRSALVYRKIKIKWCCTKGATPDERKTKVVELFPLGDSIYLP
jgi:hypothetical protein